mgnify:CR=1 FL=1
MTSYKKQYFDLIAENDRLTIQFQQVKQALEEIRDRLIVVTEEEPRSTKNLVLDLKPIIEGVLK